MEPVAIIKREVKHVRLRVTEDARIELVVPADFTEGQAELILRKKKDWIDRQLQFFRSHVAAAPNLAADQLLLFGTRFRVVYCAELGLQVRCDNGSSTLHTGRNFNDQVVRERWLRSIARSYFKRRLEELAALHGFSYRKLLVKGQRTRWGNCSPSRNISLNWRLIHAPKPVIDYVMLHELLHTQIPNHSQRFWVHLAARAPKFREALQWLRLNKPIAKSDKCLLPVARVYFLTPSD